MPTEDVIQVSVLAVLLFLSAFFSSAETAMTCASRIRIRSAAEEGDKRAVRLLSILEQADKMLSAILIGNNIVNISASSLATTLAIRFFGSKAVGLCTGLLTLFILIFGEITPKTTAKRQPERLALSYSGFILLLMQVLTPVIFVVDHLSGLLLALLRQTSSEENDTPTEQELRTMVDAGHEGGVLEQQERNMILNVFDFGDSIARDVMVPRADMVCIDVDDSFDTVVSVFRKQKFTRLPVCAGSRDHVIGILNIKDFLLCDSPKSRRIADIMYEPYFTFETKKTSELFSEMRERSVSLCIVLDEYGTVTGMVTLEDLLEELVGEIRDEYDEDEKDLIRQISPDEYLIEGAVKLDDLNDALSMNLQSEDYDSIGGYIIGQLDRLPAAGETILTPQGDLLKVEKVVRHRIASVRLIKAHTDCSGPVSDESV